MKEPKTKITIGILSSLIVYVCLNSWYKTHYPEAFVWEEEDVEETTWIATSKSWFDRKACRWLGICGAMHLSFATSEPGPSRTGTLSIDDDSIWQNAWTEGNDRPEDWSDDERVLREIPDYVIEYAPLVHLFSGEKYWPGDIAEHLFHTTPYLNYTPMQSSSLHPTLNNLDQYNEYEEGQWVFLQSNDDPESRPEWLGGEKNIPQEPDDENDDFADNDGWVHYEGRTYLQGLKDAAGDIYKDVSEWFAAGQKINPYDDMKESETAARARLKIELEDGGLLHQELRKRSEEYAAPVERKRGGRSDAPAVLVVVNKGNGVVDAFWFFFYSFNLGNVVFNIRFGNHVGDWEHTCVRFHHGQPKAVFFSEHAWGSTYSYEAVEKYGKRPVIYSAVGTHAMYATSGLHPYVLPWGILHDETDRGPLWDPALNNHAYTYDYKTDNLRSSNLTPHAPTEWFHFRGKWGDKFYPLNDKRQYRFAGQYHYCNGPLGPKFKNLGRKKLCGGPSSAPCVIKQWLGGETRIERLRTSGVEADSYAFEMEELEMERLRHMRPAEVYGVAGNGAYDL